MKITPQIKAMAASYARTAVSAALAVWMTGNHDVSAIGVAAATAVLGPLRYLNKNDSAFGLTKG
jgi:hypothetical protein